MKSSILSAKEVSKSFAHNGGQVHILSHVSLDLYKGEHQVQENLHFYMHLVEWTGLQQDKFCIMEGILQL